MIFFVLPENVKANSIGIPSLPPRLKRRLRLLVVTAFAVPLISALGCVQSRYPIHPIEPDQPNPVLFGEPNSTLDRLESAVQFPRRLFARDTLDNNDNIADSKRLDALLTCHRYLERNGLGGVALDIRRYAPKDQWRRLKQNQRIHPLVKYTFGIADLAKYTLIPNRIFRRDRFSPFTNTLQLNSTNPESAFMEVARAKEVLGQPSPSIGAMMISLPITSTLIQLDASSDALTYASLFEDVPLSETLFIEAYSEGVGSIFGDATLFVPAVDGLPWYGGVFVNIVVDQIGGGIGMVAFRQHRKQKFVESENEIDSEMP